MIDAFSRPQPDPADSSRGPLVLAVDDDPGLLRLIELRLRGASLRTAGVTSGRAALEWLAREPADLVLVDFNLPDMLADELVAQMRVVAGRDVPFIVITGFGDERIAVEMMKNGARDYLRKDTALLDLLPAVVSRTLEQLERERRAGAAEEALRLLHSAVYQANDGVLITTSDLDAPGPTIVFANPAFQRLTGYDEPELLGHSPRILQGLGTDRVQLERMRSALGEGRSWSGELLNYRKDKTPYLVQLNVAPVRDDAGRITHFVALERDVTERSRLEEQMKQTAKLEAVGSLASGIAHDFNNMLAVIRGHAELMLDGVAPGSPLHESVDAIRGAGEHAAALTRQLLSFSRRNVLQAELVDLNQVVARTVKLLARVIGERIEVVVEGADGLPAVRVDRHQVEQVILNLAVNARDAMPDGGRLLFRLESVDLAETGTGRLVGIEPGRYACLAVIDTGSGMDAVTLSRVFEPFFTTKGLGKGTGLGLATVYGIVTQSGGHIRATSQPGRGTRFDVLFPEASARAADSRPADAPVASARGSESVLVAEDEPLVRNLVVRCLEEAGFRVFAAGDGRAALELAPRLAGTLHALVTDVAMPNVTGPDVAARLRATWPGMKVVFLSAHAAGSGEPAALGGTAFLQKPFAPRDLVDTLRKLLDA
jgi:PAS domain S-box-containing protein